MIPLCEGRPEQSGMSDGESERRHCSDEAGELNPEDPVERRLAPGYETVRKKRAEMSSSGTIYTKRERIAQMARSAPDMAFTSLNQYLDMEWLKEAYRLTRKDGARGVDGRSGREDGENLEEIFLDLLNRAKSGSYRAPPVRRVHIPKGKGGETRPIGIPTFEDKVLQRAVVMILECKYEEDFYFFSYGFRPRRSVHQALDEIREQTIKGMGTWVIDWDLRKYFDTVSHVHLRTLLNHRVRDGVLLLVLRKILPMSGSSRPLTLSHQVHLPKGLFLYARYM